METDEAALVGVPSGTVKARLHRARGRLRRLLAAEFDDAAAGPGIHEAGEIPMIEVTVDDVVAIILALHTGAPLFVASEMLEVPIVVMAGTALDQLEEYVRRKREARNEAPEVPAMAWQRFRSLPRAENPLITGP